MKKVLFAAAALIALPVVAQAQSPQPSFYVGVEGGANWLLNTTILGQGVSPAIGWAAGGKVGYDFVGPRVELEGVYRNNQHNVGFPGRAINNQIGQVGVLANLLYDFFPASTITPYVGAGAGVAFINSDQSLGSTQFAYQGIVGLAWNASDQFRVSLDGRYYGTLNPAVAGTTWSNQNITAMLSLTYKFGQPAMVAAAPPPPAQPAPPSFMVFFDFDRSDLSAQAQSTIQQAATAYKAKGSARVTATGHADKSGPDAYNMALSLRRANAVKDALVRNGVPATAIAVVGRGESMPLVQTADGVREPQNRRVEIVVQ